MIAVQSVLLDSGLGPLREPAGAWSAQAEFNTESLQSSRGEPFLRGFWHGSSPIF